MPKVKRRRFKKCCVRGCRNRAMSLAQIFQLLNGAPPPPHIKELFAKVRIPKRKSR